MTRPSKTTKTGTSHTRELSSRRPGPQPRSDSRGVSRTRGMAETKTAEPKDFWAPLTLHSPSRFPFLGGWASLACPMCCFSILSSPCCHEE